MIVAGIDEAGYGPVLGPLLVGCAAFRVPEGAPDLWKHLRPVVSATRDRSGRKLHVADSKQVYSPSVGLANLERSVLCFAGAAGLPIDSLDALVAAVDPGAGRWLARHPWYAAGEGEAFPVAVSAVGLGPTTNGLRVACRGGVEVVRLAARVTPEGRYNELVGGTRNKASALFALVAQLLDGLLTDYAGEGLSILCDRQGGREHYGEPLRTMFPDWRLGIEEETPASARYTLTRSVGGATQVARIAFKEKGESESMATALASMLAKYLREALMHRFNRWWAGQLPGVAPTAGYYTDGMRFLRDIHETRTRLGIADAMLVRER